VDAPSRVSVTVLYGSGLFEGQLYRVHASMR
jgi:hypothetical protein